MAKEIEELNVEPEEIQEENILENEEIVDDKFKMEQTMKIIEEIKMEASVKE